MDSHDRCVDEPEPLRRSGVFQEGIRQYAIISTQRSGTHLLASLLSSHPEVFCLGECFHQKESKYNFYKKSSEGGMRTWIEVALKRHDENEWRRFVERTRRSAKRCATRVGPIVMYNQYERLPPAIARNLLGAGKVIHLVRENVLRTLVSDYINRNDQQPPHSRKTREKGSWVIPCEGLYQRLRDRQRRCREFREHLAGCDVLEISYEQLTTDTQAVVDRVFSHLGVAAIDASTTLQPSNPWPLREIIRNVDDVEKEISGTDLEWMLEH